MKKIVSLISSTLLLLLLTFAPYTQLHAAQEGDNLQAWAQMYEDMNKASGGEIDAMMKELEESGELDALMKELEESGELDVIIDAMLKSSPDEFMQQIEQDMKQQQNAPVPAHIPAPQKPSTPKTPQKPVPVIKIDKTKIKELRALLNSIITKITAIRQKASVRRAVQDQLDKWEYHLNDIVYYLHKLQDDALIKYLQEKEFEQLYNSLIALNQALSIEEPRLQVEEILEIEYKDPYIALGFTSSNVPFQEVKTTYYALEKQKNPFAIKQKLQAENKPADEIAQQFKIAQQEYNKMFDAYQRIEQKETSADAFLKILQAFHKAVYQDTLLQSMQAILNKYDPEALKLKQEQEQKEKVAREYKAQLAKQRPSFIPPVFDWPAPGKFGRDGFGDRRRPGTGYRPSAARPSTQKDTGQAGSGGKADDKKDAKKAPGKSSKKKKSAEKKKADKEDKDTKDKKAKELTKGEKHAQTALNNFSDLEKHLTAQTIADPLDNVFKGSQPYENEAIALQRLRAIQNATTYVKNNRNEIEKHISDIAKESDEKQRTKELKTYYKKTTEAFEKHIDNNATVAQAMQNVFSLALPADPAQPVRRNNAALNIDIQNAQALHAQTIDALKNLQNQYAQLEYAAKNINPHDIKRGITTIRQTLTQHVNTFAHWPAQFNAAIANQQVTAFANVTKQIQKINDLLQKGFENVSTTVQPYYTQQATAIIGELTNDQIAMPVLTKLVNADVANASNENKYIFFGQDIAGDDEVKQQFTREDRVAILQEAWNNVLARIT